MTARRVRGRGEPAGHVPWRLARWLGGRLGDRVGHLDTSTRPGADHELASPWDEAHRRCTVVDGYSAVVDLADLRRGGIDVVIQALSADELYTADPAAAADGRWSHLFEGPQAVERIRRDLDEHLRFASAYEPFIDVARTAADTRRVVDSGRVAMVLMLKSGWIDDDLGVLETYRSWGIRVMALCHLAPFAWADSSSGANATPGLSEFGRRVVGACNDLGLLVDLSHASDATCRHALETTRRPVIATHSKCRALSGSPRDLPDELLRGIAGTGGVVGILALGPRSASEMRQARLRRDRRLLDACPEPFDLARAKLADAEVWGTKLDLAHIDHAVDLVGVDHVGLASHAQNPAQWREFTGVLRERGYGQQETEKILGGNLLRVLAGNGAGG